MTTTHRNRLVTTISNTPGGAGALTISTAQSGYRTFTAADDGLSFDVSIVDGTAWEIRTGCVYTHAGTSLSRGTLEDSSTGSAITLTSAAVVTDSLTAGLATNIETQLIGDIDGLEMVWVSATAVTINTGSAQIESTGSLVRVTAAIAVTGLSLSSSTWYHVYLYSASGTPTVEVSSTAPATPYFATARSKTGDTTRRYIGSLRTDASGNLFKFMNDPLSGLIAYRTAGDSSIFRVLSAGTATTSTTVSTSNLVPITSNFVLVKLSNTDAAALWMLAHGDETATSTNGYVTIVAGVRSVVPAPLNASQQLAYVWQVAPYGGAFIDVLGYWYKR